MVKYQNMVLLSQYLSKSIRRNKIMPIFKKQVPKPSSKPSSKPPSKPSSKPSSKPVFQSNDSKSLNLWNNIIKKENGKRNGNILEQLTSIILQHEGYIVTMNGANLSGTSGDNGIDLIGYKDRTQIIVQCKNYKEKIGVSSIRELAGSYQILNNDNFENFELLFLTSSYFTKPSIEYVEKYNTKNKENSIIKLYDRDWFLEKINLHQIDITKFNSLFNSNE